MWVRLTTCFPFGSPEYCLWAKQRVTTWLTPDINLEHLGSDEPPWRQYFTCAVTTHWWKKLSTSSGTPWGEDHWKFVPGFLQTLPRVPFTFADFALYSLTIIDHICGYDSMLSSVSPSRELQNQGVVLGTQHTFPLLDFASLFPLLLLVSPGSISLINCVHPNPWPGLCF